MREANEEGAAMAEQADEQTLRQGLPEQYSNSGAAGLNELSSGNVGCRIGDDMLISPSGASADAIEAGAVVRMSLDGRWQGERKPLSEWRMHAIYKKTRASAVVPPPPTIASLFPARPGPAGFHYLVGTFGGSDGRCDLTYLRFPGTCRQCG